MLPPFRQSKNLEKRKNILYFHLVLSSISFFSVKVHKTKAYENERDSDSSSELKIDEPTILVEDEFQPENQSVVEACKESKVHY